MSTTGMTRFRRRGLYVVAGVGLLVGGCLWALPEIVRRVALDQIPRRTGRAVSIGHIDLNLFTGRLAINGFRLADREGPEPFVAFERLDVQLSLLALLRSHAHFGQIVLAAPSLRIARGRSGAFNFSDLVGKATEPSAEAAPGRWTVTVDRLSITRGRIQFADDGVTPAAEWVIRDLDFEQTPFTTRSGAAPGRLALSVRINQAALTVRAEPLRLDPLLFRARVTLDGFEVPWLNPYVFEPAGTPYRPKGGRLTLAMNAEVESDDEDVRKAVVSGVVSLEGESLVEVGHQDPFLSVARLGLEIKEADIIARALTVASVAIDGLDLKARRSARGAIDLVEIFTPKASPPPAAAGQGSGAATALPGPGVSRSPPAGPAAPGGASTPSPQPAPSPARPPRRTLFPILRALVQGFGQIQVERITLGPSVATFVDEGTTPPTRLPLTKLQARVDHFTWPVKGPATVTLSTGLPGGGTLDAKGPVIAVPLDLQLTIAVRNAPVEPYQTYIPIPARLSGRFSGDSQNRIALRDGVLVAQSKGNSWAQSVEIREPGAERAAIRVERMDLVGIDFDWPTRVGVVKAGFRRPRVEVERAADGSINLRRLFTAQGPGGAAAAAEPASTSGTAVPASKPKGLLETMRLEFRETRIEDGVIRFLDRTTTPAFTQDLSRFELTVTDLGNRPDRRAKLALQSVVGGEAALDIRGEINPLGAPAFIDLVGELRSYKLPSVDPYMAANLGWTVKKGDLQYKVRFKLDRDQLSADNDVVVGQLQVAPATGGDEVKRRIGLPLGLIVALVKDQKGDIRASVPVTGAVNDPKFDLRETIWTAIKNALVNIVTAPFKAIGGLFSSAEKVEEPKVDPVTFAPGSSVLSPAMEGHLVRVGDFLRGSPFVNLALTSVPARADVEALRGEAVTARVRDFQKEQGLPETAAALAAYFKAHLPDVPLPPTVDEQLALLREREPVPDALLADLGRRRLEATRERLVTGEGIPLARLAEGEAASAPPPRPARPPEATGEGRVEFAIVAGE